MSIINSHNNSYLYVLFKQFSSMSVHIGEIIKKIVKSKGVSVTDFADRINYSRRNVYEIFDKPTIDTGLLIKISKELGQNLFLFYISDKEITEHQALKKSAQNEFIQTVEQLKKIVDELEVKTDALKSKSLVLGKKVTKGKK